MIKSDRNISNWMVKAIITTPFIIVLLFALITINSDTRNAGLWLLAENKPVEILTFIFLLFGSIYGVILTYSLYKTYDNYVIAFYSIFSILLFVIAMEEIAWGQQFFNFDTPIEWKKVNLQGETTLHNIEGLQGKSEIFRLIYGIGGIIGILFNKFSVFFSISSSRLLWPWFLIIVLHSSIDVYTDVIQINEFYDRAIQRTSELIELLISISAFLYLWLNKKIINKNIHSN